MAEVAGLALAVVPLLISALEHRQGISRPLRAFFKFRQELSTALIDLRYVFVAYDQSVRLLLNTRSLSSQLKRDLGSAYDESMGLLKRIEATMETIAADLDIGGSDQVLQHGLQTIIAANPQISDPKNPSSQKYQLRGRLKFTRKIGKVTDGIHQLEEYNRKLQSLLDNAKKIGASQNLDEPASQTSIEFVADLQTIQANVARVHNGLIGRWCLKPQGHQTGLLLEQRLRRRRRHRQGPLNSVGMQDRYGVSIRRCAERSWFDTEVHVSCDVDTATSYPNITIAPPEPSTSAQRSSTVVSEVRDICMAIQSAAYPNSGFSLNKLNVLCGFHHLEARSYFLANSAVTLNGYLPVIKRKEHSIPDLYCLAITLAASVLQLSETPCFFST
ncbi:hypothetical protein CPAR01_15495 [Colletotrichum paranaense]|uniref:Fungal N-terminal domain-containing protein n=1 Tax=Colletotrichum paranaense TaxID=1914294 RepID=A0ABQ9RZC1_9PEZI|nr:uncharacterized protein CPAR01_15495 [Colletotrichum paranaense]KAK1520002.1 hypothetical protein CPAR01_15495 [Colletotrichum paranaense]